MKQSFFFLSILSLVGLVFYFFFYSPFSLFGQSDGQLSVKSHQTEVSVFLNGVNIGKTPFQSNSLKTGDYDLVLKKDQISWQTKLSLTSKTLSIVEANLSTVETFTSATNLSYKQGSGGLLIITKPAGGLISIAGQKQDSQQEKFHLSEGEHFLTIEKSGYLALEIPITIKNGYGLNALVYLSVDPFGQTRSLENTSKLVLFSLFNTSVDLSKNYSDWVEGVKHTQEVFSGGQTRFDLLIDPTGKTYVLYPTEWDNKVSTKAVANIGYLASDSSGQLSSAAKTSWENLKIQFN